MQQQTAVQYSKGIPCYKHVSLRLRRIASTRLGLLPPQGNGSLEWERLQGEQRLIFEPHAQLEVLIQTVAELVLHKVHGGEHALILYIGSIAVPAP